MQPCGRRYRGTNPTHRSHRFHGGRIRLASPSVHPRRGRRARGPRRQCRVGIEPGVAVGAHQETAAAVHVGLWVSATRCLLTYVVAPLVGALGVLLGPLGLLLQVAGAITATARAHRLWVLRSRLRLLYAGLALAVNTLALVALFEVSRQVIGGVLR